MHAEYWGLTTDPFGEAFAAEFFSSAAHDESLARLQFAVTHHHRPALLLAEGGCGKTHVLRELASQLTAGESLSPRRYSPSVNVAHVSLLGQTAETLLTSLNAELTASSGHGRVRAGDWQRLCDHLLSAAHQEKTTALLLDDAGLAQSCCHTLVTQLCQWGDIHPQALAIVLASDRSGITNLPTRLLDRCQLKTDLGRWSDYEVEDYLLFALTLVAAGDGGATSPENIFSDSAIQAITQLSGGAPRKVRQLAHWALVAAAGSGLAGIDGETVQSAADELGIVHDCQSVLAPTTSDVLAV